MMLLRGRPCLRCSAAANIDVLRSGPQALSIAVGTYEPTTPILEATR
jgi:hypothetical protein